jgi:hypothetical protein
MSNPRKTTASINTDSPKYIERSTIGQTKFGDSTNGTDAAHKFSYGVMNAIETSTPGRPLGQEARQEVRRDMNDSSNLRIKSSEGNRVVDERHDARIAAAVVNNTSIQSQATAARAYQAYEAAGNLSNPKYQDTLGKVPVVNPETGRTHELRNHHKYP